jgi:MscS family membrane protein
MIFGNNLESILLFLLFLVFGFLCGKVITKIAKNLLSKTNKKKRINEIFYSVFNKPEPIIIIVFFIFLNIGVSFLTISLALENTITQISNVVFVYAITWIVVKLLLAFIDTHLVPKTKSKQTKQILPALKTLIIVLLLIIATLTVLSNLGYNVSTLVAGLGIGGLAVAFASRDLLENLISGVMLFSEKNFNVGDTININNVTGTIYEIGLRTTQVQTFDGTLVTVPNSKITTNFFENYSFRKKRREFFTIGVTYNTTVNKLNAAKKIIKQILLKNKFVDHENIHVAFDKFNDYSLDIRIIYYITEMDYGKYLQIKDQVNTSIKKEFEKQKIEMAFPTQTIELKK